MVIKSKIYEFLKKNLGEYLYGFQKNQLDVGLLSGHIDLVNVNFRPDKVNELLGSLGLPIQIKAGLLGKLRLKCHYTSFLSSPVEVEIDELLLVFGPIPHAAREDNPLFDDECDQVWQDEIEKKVKNLNQKQNFNSDSEIGTPSMYEPDTARIRNHKIDQMSFISEDLHRKTKHKEGFVEEDQRKHKKKRKNSFEPRNGENLANNAGKLENQEVKKIGKQPLTEEKNTVFRNKDKSSDSVHSQKPPRNNHYKYEVEEEPAKEGFLEKYFSKVMKNLTLTIKSVHIRYEDETYPYLNPFAIGFSLSKLEVKNISSEFVYKDSKITKRSPRKNSIVKEINIQNIAVYISSMASVLIPTSLWEATIHSEIGIFEAFPASEVRELIISESQSLSNSQTSSFIQPTNVSLCVTFNEEAPTLRIAGMVDKVFCKFSAAMAECIRNFFDYCTNVQIWPLVIRFRPYCRIPERPEKREHRKERKKRREIVRLWFQYAYAFVKTKRAAIRYVRGRKKDNELFKKLETQERIKEKISNSSNKSFSKASSITASSESKASILSASRQRKVPGTSALKLDDLVKEYNRRKTGPVVQELTRRPYDGELYFPKGILNSEIEICVNSVVLSIVDEDTLISLEFEGYDLNLALNTLLDEMKTCFYIGGVVGGVKDKSKNVEIFRIGGKKGYFDGKGQEFAFKFSKVYRPAEILIPNDAYKTLNMHEISCFVAPVIMSYTHNSLNHFFVIKEAMELDKCFKENLDLAYLKLFKKHCKKYKLPKIFGTELKKYALCKHLAKRFLDIKKGLDQYIIDLNMSLSPILFSFLLEFQGGVLNFHDFSPTSLLTLSLPKTSIELGKTKENAFINALGCNLESPSTPSALYEFLNTTFSICYEKIQQLQTITSYTKFKFS